MIERPRADDAEAGAPAARDRGRGSEPGRGRAHARGDPRADAARRTSSRSCSPRQIDAAKDRGDAASIASLALRLGGLLERDRPHRGAQRLLRGARLGAEEPGAARRAAHGCSATRATRANGRTCSSGGSPSSRARRPRRWRLSLARRAEGAGRRGGGGAGARAGLPGTPRERRRCASSLEGAVPRAERLAQARRAVRARRRARRRTAAERVARLREAAALLADASSADPRGAGEALALAREAAPDDARDPGRAGGQRSLAAGPRPARRRASSSASDRSSTAEAGRGARVCSLARAGRARADRATTRARSRTWRPRSPSTAPTYAAALAVRLERSRELRGAVGRHGGRSARCACAQAQVLPYAGRGRRGADDPHRADRQDPKDKAALERSRASRLRSSGGTRASAALRRLVALEEGDAAVETALRLADVCERAGRPGDARGVLERARLVAPQDRASARASGARLRADRRVARAGRAGARGRAGERRRGRAVRPRSYARAGSCSSRRATRRPRSAPLEEARALRPPTPPASAPLADAYTLAGRAQEAAVLVEQVIAPTRESARARSRRCTGASRAWRPLHRRRGGRGPRRCRWRSTATPRTAKCAPTSPPRRRGRAARARQPRPARR